MSEFQVRHQNDFWLVERDGVVTVHLGPSRAGCLEHATNLALDEYQRLGLPSVVTIADAKSTHLVALFELQAQSA